MSLSFDPERTKKLISSIQQSHTLLQDIGEHISI